MKMNIGVWIGIIAGIAGFAIAIASVITTTPGDTGIYITAGMLLLFGGMAFLFYKLLFGPMLNTSRLQKTGIPGKAVVIDIKDTGVTINNNPQVKLTLEIKNSFGQKYTTTCRTLVSRINPYVFSTGMEVPVKIDPKDEKNVIIDFSTSPKESTSFIPGTNAFSSVNEVGLKTELEQLQAEQEPIRISGKPARAIITQYNWLGIYVNGNNPYVELQLEILPESSPAFSGKTRGVIAELSVEKFQPGKQIFVKYDYYDNSKIIIDHS